MIYFYDSGTKYIGARELKPNEIIPMNATIINPNITDGKQAHFIDGAWIISDIPVEPIIEVAVEPTTLSANEKWALVEQLLRDLKYID